MTIDEYFREWLKALDREETMKIMGWLKTLNPNTLCPSLSNTFKAFKLCNYKDCKVIMLGMEPYPDKYMGKTRATGILFGNNKDIPEEDLSPSLFKVKEAAINFEIPHNIINFDNSLEEWAKQGVLMLNSSLTCEVNKIGSHTNYWRPFISKFLYNMSNKNRGIVYLLFGEQAKSFEPYINSKYNSILKVKHPSYYARTNTIMPNIFKDMNDLLYNMYGETITLYKYI